MAGSPPVSYTHLTGQRKPAFIQHTATYRHFRKLYFRMSRTLHTPVSYTHLDVYKRQQYALAAMLKAANEDQYNFLDEVKV